VFRSLLAALAALAAVVATPLSAQDFPALSGRVVDAADIIPADVEAQLTEKLTALEAQSQRQFVVATIPDLQGYDEQTFTYQMGRTWGLGDAERDDGIILMVAPNERRVRIEVGYGLEGIMTDAMSSLIIQNAIIPRFKAGDFPGGIVAGTDAIIQQLQLPEDQARLVAQQAVERRQSDDGFPFGALIWFAFVFFFFVLPMLRGRRRRRRYGLGDTVGDIILWEVGKGIARGISNGGGGSSWGGGSFGGGGGFSGGGGSFGGGGASGGW